jgi:hypothetical protein
MATKPWNISAAKDPAVTRLRLLSRLVGVPAAVIFGVLWFRDVPRALWLVAAALLLVSTGLSCAAEITRGRIEKRLWRSGSTSSDRPPAVGP